MNYDIIMDCLGGHCQSFMSHSLRSRWFVCPAAASSPKADAPTKCIGDHQFCVTIVVKNTLPLQVVSSFLAGFSPLDTCPHTDSGLSPSHVAVSRACMLVCELFQYSR